MTLFETKRLIIKKLKPSDKTNFSELFTDPKILELIPQKALNESQISKRFDKALNFQINDLKNNKCALGIYEKNDDDLIGLAAFLINEDNDKELGYRLRVDYWRKGYGKETVLGMLEYYFKKMEVSKVTADVNIENLGSVNILNKFMNPVLEFFNESDNCTDRRYAITKEEYYCLMNSNKI